MVGGAFLQLLDRRDFPIENLKLLASSRSVGKRLQFRSNDFEVEEATEASFAGVDLVFTTATVEVSRRLAPEAVKAGAVVVDDGSAFRMYPKVPLVVPEVNAEDVDWHEGILSTPNCTTVPLVMALWPVHRDNPARRVIVSTYQAVSGAGTTAVTELTEQTTAALATGAGRVEGPRPERSVYPHQIAFNAVPQIDAFLDDGYTKEERKVADETRKIMHAPDLRLAATCVRVPVYTSHSEAVTVEFNDAVSPETFRAALRNAPGVTVVDDPAHSRYPLALDAEGRDDVMVGRIREDLSQPGAVAFWLACDNLRKGAALNAIQIAETLLKRNRI